MRTTIIILAALTAAAALLSAPAEAAHRRQAHHRAFPAARIDVAAIPAYPFENSAVTARRHAAHARKDVGDTRRPVLDANGSPSPSLRQRTILGYADQPGPVLAPDQASRLGMVTIDVAGGHRITVSSGFAGPAADLITDLYARGQRFTRIKCFAQRGQGHHVSRSNHWTGDACDFFGGHPRADVVRAHGLRSGYDFADAMHVDNAKNVGGVAYWNSIKHRGVVTASAERHHHRRVRLARR